MFLVFIVPRFSTLETDHAILLLRERELIVTSEGTQFVSQDDGYIISVPSGAIPKGTTVTFKHGVIPHGSFCRFEFPNGVHPVSSILSLHSTTEENFLKPINIALPHFINCKTPDDCMNLAVFKACHTISANGKPAYHFEKMPNENLSLFSVRNKDSGAVIPYAAYSSDHCCYWCVGIYTRDDTDKAMFCLTEAKQKVSGENESRELTIHYCLSYYLPTCLKVNIMLFVCLFTDIHTVCVCVIDP